MNKRIALLYFSRQAALEAQEKSWIKGNSAHKNRQLAKSLIQQSRKAVNESGLPVFHFHEGNQEGITFGERLANAYQELYNKGYEAIVAVGNDSPEIAQLDWNSIQCDLASGKNVLGKSIRGGAYLLGITKESFQKNEFQALPWRSNQLFDNLHQQLNSIENQVIELKVLRDLNTFFDLKKFQLYAELTTAFQNLLAILLKTETIFYFILSSIKYSCSSHKQLRAPPLSN